MVGCLDVCLREIEVVGAVGAFGVGEPIVAIGVASPVVAVLDVASGGEEDLAVAAFGGDDIAFNAGALVGVGPHPSAVFMEFFHLVDGGEGRDIERAAGADIVAGVVVAYIRMGRGTKVFRSP